jgi:RNA polymerase-interacting CarD/CdnL/TRCF family regulator
MKLNVGQKVFYPYQGPCRVGAVIKKDFGVGPTDCYPLTVMDNSGDVLFIPVAKIARFGIRHLLKKSEVPRLLSQLGRQRETLATKPIRWQQRATDNRTLLAAASAFDLVRLIASLTDLEARKALSPQDRHVLDRAKRILICEVSESVGNSRSAAATQIDNALKRRKQWCEQRGQRKLLSVGAL